MLELYSGHKMLNKDYLPLFAMQLAPGYSCVDWTQLLTNCEECTILLAPFNIPSNLWYKMYQIPNMKCFSSQLFVQSDEDEARC